jgi:hypothetical protein
MKKFTAMLPVLALALAGFACTENGKQDTSADKQGIWHGFVVDAHSGAKLNFFNNGDNTTNGRTDGSVANQIYALVEGEFKAAKPCDLNGIDDDNAAFFQAGCFMVEGLPVGTFVPIFVAYTGYHGFTSRVYIFPGLEDRLNGGVAIDATGEFDVNGPVFRDRPSIYGNVKLFPVGVDYSYTLYAHVDDTPIEGVDFRCVINNSQYNDFDVVGTNEDNDNDNLFENTGLGIPLSFSELSSFLTPHGDFETVLSETTDEDGLAVFDGDMLVKGAEYYCYGDWMEEVDGVLLYKTGFTGFTVGESRTFQHVAMNAADGTDSGDDFLFVLYANYDDTLTDLPGMAGPVRIMFNRPIQILTGSVDCQAGTLGVGQPGDDTVTSALEPDVDDLDDATSESITVTVDDNIMEISPVFDSAGASSDDTDVTFGWDGIFFQPVSGLYSSDIFEFSGNGNGTGFVLETRNDAGTFSCANINATSVGNHTSLGDLTSAQMVAPQN